jgi:amidohydrolase
VRGAPGGAGIELTRTNSHNLSDALVDASREQTPALVRQHQEALHRIPELAFDERETAAYVKQALVRLGLDPRGGIAGTGLYVDLPGAGEGPTVLLRADMDGLPVDEHPEHSPRSERDGLMHACGHDGHMAIALGVADAVCRGVSAGLELPGRLAIVFQPAEETGRGGASGGERIASSGLLDDERVDLVFALHLWSYLPLGVALVPPRAVMASADEIEVVFRGPGGHAALPHVAKDTILAASQAVVALQSVVSRDLDPVSSAVISIGSFHAGHAGNVLPPEARLAGTIRASDPGTRERARERVGQIARSIAAAHGVDVDVALSSGYPPTVNDPRASELVREALRPMLGDDKVLDGPATMAAEDFSYFLERRPGVFLLLGMRDEASGAVHPHHSPKFRIAPAALPLGVEVLIRGALALMEGGARRGG